MCEAGGRCRRAQSVLGLLEHPCPEGRGVPGAVADHRPLARRAAEESLVLLQNKPAPQESILPLNPATKKIALIGPLADDARDMVGAWSGCGPIMRYSRSAAPMVRKPLGERGVMRTVREI